MTASKDQAFACARQEKRLQFQKQWDIFVKSNSFFMALILLSIAQVVFFGLSGFFIWDFANQIRLLPKGMPFWSILMMFGAQLLVNAPGFLFCFGLWMIRRKTRWENQDTPDLSGIKWMQKVNFGVILVTGTALALYPTVIIQAGENFKEEDVYKIFYLFLVSTLLLIVSATLIRLVLRGAEENISCCWSDDKFVLPLILALAAVVPAILLWAPLKNPFYISAALLAASNAYVVFRYWLFLRKVGAAQAEIDRAVIASRENPDDPYQRY